MTRNILGLIVLSAVLGVSAVAQAGSVSVVQVDNGGISDISGANLAGTVTNDILVSADVTEQIGAIQIWLRLDSGSVFQHPFGSNSPPNAGQFGLLPALPFDTFFASGFADNQRNPTVAGASVDFGSPNTGGSAVMNTSVVDATYGPEAGQPTLGALDFLVARLTLSNNASGSLFFSVDFSGQGEDPIAEYVVEEGIILQGSVDLIPPEIELVQLHYDLRLDPPPIMTQLLGSDNETAVGDLVWSGLMYDSGPDKNFPGSADPTLDGDGVFSWNPAGWRQGIHNWKATVTDLANNSTTAVAISVDLWVPEPATASLVGLALVGMVGLVRRRS